MVGGEALGAGDRLEGLAVVVVVRALVGMVVKRVFDVLVVVVDGEVVTIIVVKIVIDDVADCFSTNLLS